MPKESFFSKDNIFTKTIAKKMATVALISSLTLGNAGCNQKPIEVVNDPTTPITDVNKEPTTPTNPSTPDTKPVPNTPETPVETKTPRQIELEALLVKAPEVAGLTKAIEGDKIVYNNENKEKAGYYVEKAYYNGQETDGVSLSAQVIEGIVNKNKEEGLPGSLSIPVDPSEGQVVKVDFLQEKLISNILFKTGIITINFDKQITIVNSLYQNNLIIKHITSTIDGPATDESIYQSDSDKKSIAGKYVLTSIGSFINETNIPRQTPYLVSPGESLGQTKGVLMLKKTYKTLEDLDKYFIYESEILKINDSLVFTMVKADK